MDRRSRSARADALASGKELYFNGKPCLSGEIAPRRAQDGRCTCAKCRSRRNRASIEDYHANAGRERAAKRRKPGYSAGAMRKWRAANPEKARDADRRSGTRRRSTVNGQIANRIGPALRRWLRGGKGGRCTEQIVGYNRETLIAHLERQFVKGMGWHNMHDWHIDHIIPLSSFDASKSEDVKRAWALTNLRPLWAKDNMQKGVARDHLL